MSKQVNLPFDVDELDFSMFHDLMHTIFTQGCTEMPGGWRRHLLLWYEYQRPRPFSWLARHTLCHMNRHKMGEGWMGPKGVPPNVPFWFCFNCHGRWWTVNDSNS